MAKRDARRKDFSLMTFLNYGHSVCPFSTHTNWPQFDIYNGNLNAMGKKNRKEEQNKLAVCVPFSFWKSIQTLCMTTADICELIDCLGISS